MARKPKTPARPRDASQLAKRIVELTTGEATDEMEPVNEAARKRGDARAAKLTPAERSEIAKALAFHVAWSNIRASIYERG